MSFLTDIGDKRLVVTVSLEDKIVPPGTIPPGTIPPVIIPPVIIPPGTIPLPIPSNLYDVAVNGLLMEGYNDSVTPFVDSALGELDDAIGMPPQVTPAGFNRLKNCFRWTGCLMVQADGVYQFRLSFFPTGSLSLDGDEIYSEPDPKNAWYIKTFERTLVKGKLYPIEALNMGRDFGGVGLELRWRCVEQGIIGPSNDPTDESEKGYAAIPSKRFSPPIDWRTKLKRFTPPDDPNAVVQIVQPDWSKYINPARPVGLFPADNWWNQKIVDKIIVTDGNYLDPLSDRIIARLGNVPFHPIFGQNGVGMPTNVIADDEPMDWVKPTFQYESDQGLYPVSRNNVIALENGGSTDGSDCHYTVFYKGICYEIYQFYRRKNGTYEGAAGRIWSFSVNRILPDDETSADAAGLSIAGGTVTYDELENGVNHALRLTVKQTRYVYVSPASHKASNTRLLDDDLPPMGTLLRLNPLYDLSSFPKRIKNLFTALQVYGGYVVDNGSNFIGITGVPDCRFNDEELVTNCRLMTSNNLQVLKLGTIKGL